MLTYILIRLAFIVTISLLVWFFYWLLFSPFGPSSRCRQEYVIESFDGEILARLIVVDRTTPMPMVRSHLEHHGHRVANKSDLEMFRGDRRLRPQLPPDARLLGEQLDGRDNGVWVIDTSNKYVSDFQTTRLQKIEPPTSLEDLFIVAIPCT